MTMKTDTTGLLTPGRYFDQQEGLYHSIIPTQSQYFDQKLNIYKPLIRLCQKFILMKDTSPRCGILFLCWQIFSKVTVKLCQGLMIWSIRHPGDHSSTVVPLVHTILDDDDADVLVVVVVVVGGGGILRLLWATSTIIQYIKSLVWLRSEQENII